MHRNIALLRGAACDNRPPLQRLSCQQRNYVTVRPGDELVLRWNVPRLSTKNNGSSAPDFAARQPVKVSAVFASEAAQAIQRTCTLKGGRIQLQCCVCRVDASGSAPALFRSSAVRCTIGAQEEARRAGRDGGHESGAVCFMFQHWQAVPVRAKSPLK